MISLNDRPFIYDSKSPSTSLPVQKHVCGACTTPGLVATGGLSPSNSWYFSHVIDVPSVSSICQSRGGRVPRFGVDLSL